MHLGQESVLGFHPHDPRAKVGKRLQRKAGFVGATSVGKDRHVRDGVSVAGDEWPR